MTENETALNNKDLQIENGNYTRIVNKVLDELVKIPLLGAELAICLFVIRKTYGFNKTQDQISITQFEEGIKRSRPTISKALKNLQLVNILQLVKVGSSKTSSSVWKFNKYYTSWQLVKTSELVKDRTSTSKEKLIQLVKTPKHTKDNTKDNTKERGADSPPTPKDNTKFFFKGITDFLQKIPSSEAEAMKELLRKISLEQGIESLSRKKVFWDEIVKFGDYWQERDHLGKREKWEMEKTFEVEKRLQTWLRRAGQWSKPVGQTNNKGRGFA